MSVSVVIPTLGGDSLARTIEILNRGTVVPAEILVCLHPGHGDRGEGKHPANARVIVSGARGQVPQRIAGFRQAASEYVLQLDDDMVMYADCLEKLLAEAALRGPGCALAPSIVEEGSGESCYSVRGRPSRIERWIHGENARSPGAITRAGVNVALDFSRSAESSSPSEWLPGGCILHRRENLVLENYYEFPGKALGEDVMHSVLLRQKGISLFVVRDAKCATDLGGPAPRSIPGSLRQVMAEFRWRRQLVQRTAGSVSSVVLDLIHKNGRRALPALLRRIRGGGLLSDPAPPASPRGTPRE